MASPSEGKRRFAPIPIETTFEQFRKHGPGPAPELTPEPSPRSTSPQTRYEDGFHDYYHEERKGKRRFAPQLIDSSRRSRRAGDVGPATRPVDKTDITPYTNHIYSVQRTRKRHHKITGLARRESCDEETADHVYNLAKKEIEKRLQEIALSAFPNSGTRIGGAEHFFVREGSGDDSSDDSNSNDLHRGRPQVRMPGMPRRARRDSSEEDISWHVKEAQDAAERRGKSRMDTRELDEMELDSPPQDTMWLTSSRKETPSPTPFSRGPIGDSHMPLVTSGGALTPIGETRMPVVTAPPPVRPMGEYLMPYIPTVTPGNADEILYIPAETSFARLGSPRGFGGFGGFGAPFGGTSGFGFRRNTKERNLDQLKKNSPPLLGKDLVFRKCPSPKQTKLEPDHLWNDHADEANRDPTGQRGLWRGYCFTSEAGEALASLDRPAMISTPNIPSSSATDPFASAFGSIHGGLSEEPTTTSSPRQMTSVPPPGAVGLGMHNLQVPSSGIHKPLSKQGRAEAKGLHMLMGLDERLRKEKAAAEREEMIQAEFDDHFVTQVYNYLSLGYPSMARSYDDELSKISRISVSELLRDDDAVMDGVVSRCAGGSGTANSRGSGKGAGGAKGYIKLTEDDETPEEDRCPRWKALKLYVHEWARQHPDLESISPLAWGVSERRGSWGI